MAEEGEEKSVSSTLRWSEDEMDEDSGDGEDYVAVASKKLKANSSPHVPPRSQATRSTRARPPTNKNSLYSRLSKQDQEKLHTVLFSVIHGNYLDLLKEILQTGVDINSIKNEDGATPLWLAVDLDCTMDMITSVMTPEQVGIKYKLTGLSPLHQAVIKDKCELVLYMINIVRVEQSKLPSPNQDNREQQIKSQRSQPSNSNYDIINRKNKHGWSPLHYAADHGYTDILHVLVMERECDVATVTRQGHTAFHLAARNGHLSCLKLLFAAAEASHSLPSLPKMDKRGWNIACHASAQDNTKVMEWLIDNMSLYGADVNRPNKKGATPLLIACEYQKTEMFQLLYDKCNEVTVLTQDAKNVLHLAALHDADQIAQIILEDRDFPVDSQDERYGETALHIAYKRGSYKVQDLLIKNGANGTIKNKDGECPVDVQFKDHKIPAEIRRLGKEAIGKYMTELRKGKTKMPRCKLMILGEAGVGKTSLLSLLTGDEFNPEHNETEGVTTDFVSTTIINTDNWKKKAMEGDKEYKDAAARKLAEILPDPKLPTSKHSKKQFFPQQLSHLKRQFDALKKKYTQQQLQTVQVKPKPTFVAAPRPEIVETLSTFHQPTINLPRPTPPMYQQPINQPMNPVTFSLPQPATAPPQIYDDVHPTHTPVQRNPSTVVSHPKEKRPVTSPPPAEPSQNVPSGPDRTETDVAKQAVKLKKQNPKNIPGFPLKFSSFDFAGQDHYKPMHHCFISSRAVYVVAFNVRNLLDEHQRDQCIEQLKFWVNSIHVYTDAKVVLVGTHRGPYDVPGPKHFNVLTQKEDDYIKDIMKEQFDKICYVQQLQFFDKSIVATVENSIRGGDSGADVIREKLSRLGDGHPGNADDLPISYFRLEHQIFKEREQHHGGPVSRVEVESWAKKYGIDDPSVALLFFHDIGTIIDPRKLPRLFVAKEQVTMLQDVILISPQWLADVMKELMQLKRDSGYDPAALRQLDHKGIVDRDKILDPLWKKYHGGESDMLNQICILLQAYGLIIPMKEVSPLYYIPCKLPATPTKGNILMTQTDKCSKFHVSFEDHFLPPFTLHHLMFLMYSSAKSDGRKDKCCFLQTHCFIEWVNDCQWWLKQDNDVIHVTVRTRPSVRTILPTMQYLHEQLKTVLKELNKIDYHLGPVAICSGCKEEELLTYITYSSDKGSDYQQCTCTGCACDNVIDHNNKVIMSKAYKIDFRDFKIELDKLINEDTKKYLQRKFKKGIPKQDLDTDLSWTDILEEWYELNNMDPWPKVMSALEICEHDGTEDVVKLIKEKHLHLCHH